MRTYIRACIVAFVVLSLDVQSAPLYRITDLSSQIPFPVEDLDLNDSGQLVGVAVVGASSKAFRWDAQSGFVQLLNPSSPTVSLNEPAGAYGINNSGVVVGFGTVADGPSNTAMHALSWNAAGTPTDLGTLPGPMNRSEARAINNSGEVVGISGGSDAARWTSAGVVALPSLQGFGPSFAFRRQQLGSGGRPK